MSLSKNPYGADSKASYRGVAHGYRTFNTRIHTDKTLFAKRNLFESEDVDNIFKFRGDVDIIGE